MTTHLEVVDLWEAVEENYDVPELPLNPTVAQMKNHRERKTKKAKDKNCFFSAVKNYFYKNHELQVCQTDLGLSQIRISRL